MKILIGGAEITAKKAYAYEHANGKRELRFSIPQSSITYDGLKEVLKLNDGEIVLTKDDGTTQTFSGYKFTPEITDKTENEEAVFYVVIQCVAEAERRALEAIAKAEALEKELEEKTVTIATQTLAINSLNEQLLMVQMAAADLYEKSLETEEESMGEITMEDAEGEAYLTDDEEPEESEVQ